MNPQLRDLQLLYGQALYEAQVWKLRAEALGHNLEQAARQAHERSCVTAIRAGDEEVTEQKHDDLATASPQGEPAAQFKHESDSGRIRHALYRGLPSRVAASLGVSASIVCRVVKGKKSSGRIRSAIDLEITKIEEQVARINGASA